jgi:hypothetical protein
MLDKTIDDDPVCAGVLRFLITKDKDIAFF